MPSAVVAGIRADVAVLVAHFFFFQGQEIVVSGQR
jgi:hypothetical protein